MDTPRTSGLGWLALLLIVAAAVALLFQAFHREASAPATVRPQPSRPAEDSGRSSLARVDLSTGTTKRVEPTDLTATTAPASPGTSDAVAAGSLLVLGTVLDPSGAALAGVRVSGAGAGHRSGPDALSNEKGEFRVERTLQREPVRGQQLQLEFTLPGHATVHRWIDLHPPRELSLGVIVLPRGGSVRGRVLDRDELAVAGATVAVADPDVVLGWSRKRMDPARRWQADGPIATSRSDGSFELVGVPVGKQRLLASSPGRLTGLSALLDVTSEQAISDVVLRVEDPDPDQLIQGLVLGPDGSPLANARVNVHSPSFQTRIESDGAGRFRVTTRAVEDHTLIAEDALHRWGSAVAREVRPGTTDLLLQLTGGESVPVTARSSEGSPLAPVEVEVLEAEGLLVLETVSSREEPSAWFRLPNCDFRLRVSAPLHAVASLGPFRITDPPEAIDCVLTPLAGLTGIVLFDGAPVPGATVSLHEAFDRQTTRAGFPLRSSPLPAGHATTDARGVFAVAPKESGTYYVRAQFDGLAPAELGPLELEPNVASAGLELLLHSGGSIEGRVQDPDGAPAAGVPVAISRGDGHLQDTRTGRNGSFRFDRLIAGRWMVAALEQELPAGGPALRSGSGPVTGIPWNCTVVEGATTRVNLWSDRRGPAARADPCELRGSLILDGAPAIDWMAQLTSEEGGTPRIPPTNTTPSGSFELSVGPPGSYQLLLRAREPETTLFFLDRVELRPGANTWSLAIETAPVEGTLADFQHDENSLTFYRWVGEGQQLGLAGVSPDSEGHFECPRVPTGRGQVVRFARGLHFTEQEGESLLELEVPRSTSLQRP